MSVDKLFTERFRPKKLDQMMMSARVRSSIGDGSLDQNYLLEGTAGTGKTSLAKVLASNYPALYINCSDERGVDTIREKITDWCSTMSVLDGPDSMKVVIMDEIDGAGDQFFKALRATMEKFTNSRFIATCNYLNKVPDPIQSRFTVIKMDPINKEEEEEIFREYIKRVVALGKKLGLEWEKEAVKEFVRRNFPDFRRILNKLQDFRKAGITSVTLEDIKTLNYSFVDVFQMTVMTPDPVKNYQFLMSNYSDKVDEVLASLGEEYPSWLEDNHPGKLQKLPQVIVTVANFQAQRVHVIQPAISMLACVFQIQQTMNS